MRRFSWGIALAGLTLLGVLAAGCTSDEGADTGSATSDSTAAVSGPTTPDTVERNGDPAFCGAIVDFQDAYGLVGEPDPAATPAEVEADWNTLAEAEGRLVASAPDELASVVQEVAAVFDQFRIDADAVGYQYTSFDDLDSSATIDPTGQSAQAAYTLFTYGEERCA